MRISIPKPCREDWGQMTLTDKGRHCAACAKTVVDFTGMGDLAVRRTLREAGPGGTCGRFYPDQLDRPLSAGVSASPVGWLALATAALVGVGSAGVLADQQSVRMPSQVESAGNGSTLNTCSVPRPPGATVGEIEVGEAALADLDSPDLLEVELDVAPPRTGQIQLSDTELSQLALPPLLQWVNQVNVYLGYSERLQYRADRSHEIAAPGSVVVGTAFAGSAPPPPPPPPRFKSIDGTVYTGPQFEDNITADRLSSEGVCAKSALPNPGAKPLDSGVGQPASPKGSPLEALAQRVVRVGLSPLSLRSVSLDPSQARSNEITGIMSEASSPWYRLPHPPPPAEWFGAAELPKRPSAGGRELISPSLATRAQELTSFRLAPNPSGSRTQILDLPKGAALVNVYDSDGSLILARPVSNELPGLELPASALPGLYIVEIVDENGLRLGRSKWIVQ